MTTRRYINDALVLIAAMAAIACSAGGAERAPATSHEHEEGSKLASEERAAYDNAQPVFEKYCVKCHTTQGSESKPKALEHFNMDAYPFGGHHATEITAAIREVLGAAGKRATMPLDAPGAVKGNDLKRILAWADAYDRVHPSTGTQAEHEHDEHEHDEHDEHDEHEHEHDEHEHGEHAE